MIKGAGYPVYATCKSATVGLSRSLARDLGKLNIRVNTLSPGWIMTEKQLTMWVDEAGEKAMDENQCLPGRIMGSDPHGDGARLCGGRRMDLSTSAHTPAIRSVWPAELLLGEGPLWLPEQQRLYFVNLKGGMLHALDADGSQHAWTLPTFICWIVP
eukprot:gene35496-58462_t